MTETNQDLQKRLNEIQAKIKYLQMEEARNQKEKESIDAELQKLNIGSLEELEKLIKTKEEELVVYNTKFEEALKKLEIKATELELKVKS
jgi:hypothetical protein